MSDHIQDLIDAAQHAVGWDAPMDRDTLKARADLVAALGSRSKAAAAIGIPRSSLRHSLKKAASLGLDGSTPHPAPEGFEVVENSTRFDKHGNKTGQTVKTARAPGEVFKIPDGHFVKGESAFVDADGQIRGKWIKTQKGATEAQALIDAVKAAFQDIPRAPTASVAPEFSQDLLNLLPIADLHLGMYAWAKETGADYDLSVAQKLFKGVYGRLIRNAPRAAELVILGLGDITHANDQTNRTPASGNVLDVDTRHDKIVMIACHLLIWAIELGLETHGKVRVRILKGNHDPEVATAVAVALALRYEDHPRVDVDISPSLVWMYRWGEVTLAAFHGPTFKAARIFALVSDWFRRERAVPTNWTRAYKGHTHHSDLVVDSDGNGTCETIQTIAAPDAYHAGHGYISDRGAVLITHHKRQPDTGRQTISVVPDSASQSAA